MRKKRDSKSAPIYDTTYRFRCFSDLKKRATRVANARGSGDASDIGREGVIKHVTAEEKRLELAPFKDNGR